MPTDPPSSADHPRPAGPSRRRFLASVSLWAVGLTAGFSWPTDGLRHGGLAHPEPRPGIDGSRVLGAAQLRDTPQLVELFDGIRTIPHIADGIRCYCGCADLDGYRSLLTCYEAPGMARYCEICQGQARLAHRRSLEGQGLDQIRRAIDARYGPGSRRGSPPDASEHCG